MSKITATLDQRDASAIAKNDFTFASDQANRLFEIDTPEACALGRIIETIIEDVDIHLTTDINDISPATKATLEVAKMLEQRGN